MVVFLELDDESVKPEEDPRHGPFSSTRLYPADREPPAAKLKNETYNGIQNWDSGFSAALACYPVVTQLASYLDLNTLHALSRTCRQFRVNLLQFRRQLIARTLRCASEPDDHDAHDQKAIPFRFRSWDVAGSYGIPETRITSGRIGPCARDMVSDCRRCGRIVCRNCIMKPRPASLLPNRFRRLCSTCVRAPLPELTGATDENAFTSSAFTREPCSCKEMAFICQPCGHATSSADVNYKRIWQWRTRYSTYLGGLGTGIGEGNEGVKCGRGDRCLAAQEIEVEIDSRSEDLSSSASLSDDPDDRGGTPIQEAIGEDGDKAGYLRQEIDGVGGIVRKKFRKRVRVGRTVKEYEDERDNANHMAREAKGESRSWCGWCNRVVLVRKDIERLEKQAS